jgi:hypothetical protein
MEAFRKFRVKYGSDAEGIAKIKEGIIKKFSDPAMSAFALTWDPFEIPCLDDWPALLLRKRLGTHVVLGSCSLVLIAAGPLGSPSERAPPVNKERLLPRRPPRSAFPSTREASA